ncbi:hypothetical protein [Kitasatospora sp. GP82]|uniref:hypothetical protein n=1 Tax=Kitasatospora sp. GP82 TaxID=3035089 RepID=UPI0024751083|nr:hypothetical protein [Kitasatospora sp. GP82]MDH6124155.1 hypothetical protein [Kitasatospora sp. GP82]
MKQATLKAAGTAALGIAIAAAAGSASAATGGGFGTPVSALNHTEALTGAAGGAVNKLPGGDGVTETVGTLNPGVANALAPAADAAPDAATRALRGGNPVTGALGNVPGAGALTGALGGGVPGVPGLGG